MLKKCSKCCKFLDHSQFNWKIKSVKLSYQCKNCSREYIRSHYYNHRDYYLSKAKKRNEIVKKKAVSYLGPYLLTHPCIDCGEKDILVLEFDHKERETKEAEIRRIIQNGGSLNKIMKEVAKCEVRCANCHRRKTEIENKSWKLKYAPVA